VTIEQVSVPDIGGAEDAEVVELLVAVGDSVAVDQGLIVLESDKASMEIPSTVSGVVVELLVSEGDQLVEGAAVARIEAEGGAEGEEAGDAEPVEAPVQAAASEQTPAPDNAPAPGSNEASPQAGDAGVLSVVVPDIGGAEDAEVIELLVAAGDTVSVDQGLIVLESDKASMEIPSSAEGTVLEVLVKEGDQLSEGAVVARIEVSGGASTEPAAESTISEPAPAEVAPAVHKVSSEEQAKYQVDRLTEKASVPVDNRSAKGSVYAGPAVRKLAREFGVPLEKVTGTGPQGRILKQDLHKFVQDSLDGGIKGGGESPGSAIPAVPEIDFAKFGEVELTTRSKLDKLTANNMHRSWLNVPHVTQTDDADITELEAFRKGLAQESERRGVKMSPLPFVLKACAVALKENPKLNSSLAADSTELVFKKYCHIGMAVDTPAGLVVPVIRDVDRKSLWELAEEVIQLAGKARDRKLTPAEMQGGCFTVSSLGNIGGTGFTPIVNTPEVGILGVSRAAVKPVWDGSEFQPRTMLPLSLSYDHRVVNGGDGGRFLTRVSELLGDIRHLLL
jgi:pyruvate dehydrogenase E2 component (dihydrolipoyllysine-residue acetyltransferase)